MCEVKSNIMVSIKTQQRCSRGANAQLLVIVLICQTYYGKSDQLGVFTQDTMACEVDIIWQYLQQICIHHIEFKVCLVSYPFVHAVFSTFANSEKSIFLCGLFKKCIIKQLLNSVFFFFALYGLPNLVPVLSTSACGFG